MLLDLALPDMDGLTVSERLHRFSRGSVIVLTADDHDDRKIVALDGGAVDYVRSPFRSRSCWRGSESRSVIGMPRRASSTTKCS